MLLVISTLRQSRRCHILIRWQSSFPGKTMSLLHHFLIYYIAFRRFSLNSILSVGAGVWKSSSQRCRALLAAGRNEDICTLIKLSQALAVPYSEVHKLDYAWGIHYQKHRQLAVMTGWYLCDIGCWADVCFDNVMTIIADFIYTYLIIENPLYNSCKRAIMKISSSSDILRLRIFELKKEGHQLWLN